MEDEGIIMSIKPSIPFAVQNRSQVQLPNAASVSNFAAATNQMVSSNNQSMLPYSQNYFGNQAIATPGFTANNFPSSSVPNAIEPMGRRKSIIENINPFLNEQKHVLPQDLLSAFPVSILLFFQRAVMKKSTNKRLKPCELTFIFFSTYRRICYMFVCQNCQLKVSRFC